MEWRQLLEQLVTAAAVAEGEAVPGVEAAKGRRLTQLLGPGFSHGRRGWSSPCCQSQSH